MIEGLAGTGYVSNVYLFRKAGTRGRSDVLSPVTPIAKISPLSSGRDNIVAVASYARDNTELFQNVPLQRTSQDEKIINAYEEQEVAQYNLSNPYENVRMAAEGVLLAGLHFDQLV
ncbi:MAG: hypothetical protein J1E62_12185 [Lachnospiraceae bacterium]|nr:hypothetical protein [Lachnospiraceae bacterium]